MYRYRYSICCSNATPGHLLFNESKHYADTKPVIAAKRTDNCTKPEKIQMFFSSKINCEISTQWKSFKNMKEETEWLRLNEP